MTEIISNITIVMNHQKPAPLGPVVRFTKDTPELFHAKQLLDHSIGMRNVALLAGGDLRACHDRVLLLRSVLADLEEGA